jgi:hypothetical protein
LMMLWLCCLLHQAAEACISADCDGGHGGIGPGSAARAAPGGPSHARSRAWCIGRGRGHSSALIAGSCGMKFELQDRILVLL